MLILLSPAKSLDFETPVQHADAAEPRFAKQATQLMKSLKKLSAAELSELMSISESLGELNRSRNRSWKANHSPANSKPAVYAFQGDVYQGLEVESLSNASVNRCQKHVRILSGLYGMLRPLDLIQPYRLEMGSKLANAAGKDLYKFWGDTIRDAVAQDLALLKSPLVINLASNEYSKAARLKTLDAEIITPGFREQKGDQYKMISFFAKRARGLMTRFLVSKPKANLKTLLTFDLDGYQYNPELSTDAQPMFTRQSA